MELILGIRSRGMVRKKSARRRKTTTNDKQQQSVKAQVSDCFHGKLQVTQSLPERLLIRRFGVPFPTTK